MPRTCDRVVVASGKGASGLSGRGLLPPCRVETNRVMEEETKLATRQDDVRGPGRAQAVGDMECLAREEIRSRGRMIRRRLIKSLPPRRRQ